jgi:hypothetical protein
MSSLQSYAATDACATRLSNQITLCLLVWGGAA